MKARLIVTVAVLLVAFMPVAESQSDASGFVISGADATTYLSTMGSAELSTALAGVATRFVAESADAMHYLAIAPIPVDLQNSLGQLVARFVFEYADANRVLGFAYPVALIADTVPPQLSALTVTDIDAGTVHISWTTNEFARVDFSYGTQPGVYTHTFSDPLYYTSHQITLSGLAAGVTYYYRVTNTDRSGNAIQSGERSFTVRVPTPTPTSRVVYVPFVRR